MSPIYKILKINTSEKTLKSDLFMKGEHFSNNFEIIRQLH